MAQGEEVSTPAALDRWLAALGQSNGAPGGGAASGVLLGVAASLLSMVAAYTPDDPDAAELVDRSAIRRGEALRCADDDGAASADFGAALALSTDDPERDARVRSAAIGAAESSVRLGAVGIDIVQDLTLLREIGNPNLSADLAVAAAALAAGLSGASVNLRADLRTARSHGASGERFDALLRDSARLSDAERVVARIRDELSAGFDDEAQG